MTTLQSRSSIRAHIYPVTRKLSDRAAFIWAFIWTLIVVPLLAFFWLISDPLSDLLFTFMVLIGLLISTLLIGLVSRVDATLALGVAPAMLFILLESTDVATTLALWGTAYFVGMLMRLRNLGDAAETTAYILGCAFACIAALDWIRGMYGHTEITAVVIVVIYVAVRLIISSIRLTVVTPLSLLDIIRGFLPKRIVLFTIGISIVAIIGHTIQYAAAIRIPSIGMYGGGALAISSIGVAAFALGISFESRVLGTQLRGTLKAALDLPWTTEQTIEEHAVHYTEEALPQYTIELRPQAERNFNEIVSPLTDGYLVARRGSTQAPFLTQDQRVLDAIAHIADTMAAERHRPSAIGHAQSFRPSTLPDQSPIASKPGIRPCSTSTSRGRSFDHGGVGDLHFSGQIGDHLRASFGDGPQLVRPDQGILASSQQSHRIDDYH